MEGLPSHASDRAAQRRGTRTSLSHPRRSLLNGRNRYRQPDLDHPCPRLHYRPGMGTCRQGVGRLHDPQGRGAILRAAACLLSGKAASWVLVSVVIAAWSLYTLAARAS